MKRIRLYAFAMDNLLVLLPCQLLVAMIFENYSLQLFVPQFFLFLYNLICVLSFNGQTIGKYFARLQVVTPENQLMLGAREGAKLLYSLPNVGWLFALSALILWVTTGNSLHDWVGQSTVKSLRRSAND